MGSTPLDAVDHAILYHLQRDARIPITALADAVNVSDNTVRNRIQALEDRGVITGYQVTVDYDAAGVQHHYLFVCSARVSERESLAETARQLPGVTEVLTLMTGKCNVFILGVASEKDEITELAYHLDELGLVIERENLVRAHARQPYEAFRLEESM